MSKLATAVENSKNGKTGIVSATYGPIKSCPDACPLKNNGCYAQLGNVFFTVKRLNKAVEENDASLENIAEFEAKEIDKLSGKNPLRLHVSGDCRTNECAKILAAACERYTKKHGQPVWTYTHAWRDIDRSSWGKISVLASCETLEQCKEASAKGYATALLRPEPFQKTIKENGLRLVPCKELTKGISCTDCKLCFKDKAKDRVICFFPHGCKAKEVKKLLEKE